MLGLRWFGCDGQSSSKLASLRLRTRASSNSRPLPRASATSAAPEDLHRIIEAAEDAVEQRVDELVLGREVAAGEKLVLERGVEAQKRRDGPERHARGTGEYHVVLAFVGERGEQRLVEPSRPRGMREALEGRFRSTDARADLDESRNSGCPCRC